MPDSTPSTPEVKRALRRLAFAAADTDSPEKRGEQLVTRGVGACENIDDAATFVAEIGLSRFEHAIDECDQDGNHSLAKAGRDALSSYREFRRVANHFHSGRGTPLRRDAQ